jgi:hypothetical protein
LADSPIPLGSWVIAKLNGCEPDYVNQSQKLLDRAQSGSHGSARIVCRRCATFYWHRGRFPADYRQAEIPTIRRLPDLLCAFRVRLLFLWWHHLFQTFLLYDSQAPDQKFIQPRSVPLVPLPPTLSSLSRFTYGLNNAMRAPRIPFGDRKRS